MKKFFNKTNNYIINTKQYNKFYTINLYSSNEHYQFMTKASNPIQVNSLKDFYNNYVKQFIDNNNVRVIFLNSKIVNNGIKIFNKIIINDYTYNNINTNIIHVNDQYKIIIDYNKGIIITNIDLTNFQLQFKNHNIINQLIILCYIKENKFLNTQNISFNEDKQIYFNTIGIYNQKNQLLMIARLNKNLKRIGNQSFILKNQF